MSTARGTQRRVIALLLLLAALGGLGADALGAAAERAPITTVAGTTERERPSSAATAEVPSDPGWSTPEVPPQPPRAWSWRATGPGRLRRTQVTTTGASSSTTRGTRGPRWRTSTSGVDRSMTTSDSTGITHLHPRETANRRGRAQSPVQGRG